MKKQIKIRQRILAAFSALLFFSYILMTVIFRIFITQFSLIFIDSNSNHQFWDANTLTITVLALTFLITVIATYFLSNSITRPIEKLVKFALEIGKGNFKPNNFEFKDQELQDLNNALNKSAEQLGIYDEEQKTFFQNVSHELRTPLMSIKCYAEGISFGIMDSKQASETILGETDRLTELVKNLLYIAQIDNITTIYERNKVDLIEMIHTCMDRQNAMAEKENIQVIFTFEDEVLHYVGVKELLSRAVDNLISNAIRYAHSEISLACFKKGNHIKIVVSDDGDGVEPEILPHVFERFHKGKNGNTGIGLSIVKSIAQQHGGYVRAKNLEDGGARFTITLKEM